MKKTIFLFAIITIVFLSSCSRYTTHCNSVRKNFVGYR